MIIGGDAFNASKTPYGRYYVSARLDENALLQRYGSWDRMLSRAKHLGRNNFAVKAAKNVMCDYVVGASGPTPRGGDAEHRKAWARWSRSYCDIQGRRNWAQILRDIVGTMVEGDILAVLTSDDEAPDNQIQARVQLIDPGRVRTPGDLHYDADRVFQITEAGNPVIMGVEFSKRGKEIAYWVAPPSQMADKQSEFVRIPRYDAGTGRFVSILLRRPDNDNSVAVRSIPMFSAIMPELEDMASLADSAIQMGISRSKLGVLFTTDQPQAVSRALGARMENGEARNGYNSEGEIVNYGLVSDGAAMTIPGATGVHTVSHQGNMDIVALMNQVWRHMSAGIDIPLEILMSNFQGVNFSSGKLSYDKFYRKVRAWVQSLSLFCSEVYSVVALESDLISVRAPVASWSVRWSEPAMPDSDPSKSSSADMRLRDSGLVPSSTIVAQRSGDDYAEHLMQIAEDKALEEKILGKEIPTSLVLRGKTADAEQDVEDL